jgi:hypothetical protein
VQRARNAETESNGTPTRPFDATSGLTRPLKSLKRFPSSSRISITSAPRRHLHAIQFSPLVSPLCSYPPSYIFDYATALRCMRGIVYLRCCNLKQTLQYCNNEPRNSSSVNSIEVCGNLSTNAQPSTLNDVDIQAIDNVTSYRAPYLMCTFLNGK